MQPSTCPQCDVPGHNLATMNEVMIDGSHVYWFSVTGESVQAAPLSQFVQTFEILQ